MEKATSILLHFKKIVKPALTFALDLSIVYYSVFIFYLWFAALGYSDHIFTHKQNETLSYILGPGFFLFWLYILFLLLVLVLKVSGTNIPKKRVIIISLLVVITFLNYAKFGIE